MMDSSGWNDILPLGQLDVYFNRTQRKMKHEQKNPLNEASEHIHRRVDAEMVETITESRFSELERIALACRYLSSQGHGNTLAGQISVKLDDGSFWTTEFSTGFADASVSNLVRVDERLDVVEGKGMANPATRFHLWVYSTRPDVRSIVHTHPPYASALAMCGERLVVSHMDMMMFHEDVAYLRNWPGVPLANEEGRIISGALGNNNSILLANHGILTAGDTLARAVYLAVNLESAARLQLFAASAGYKPLPIDSELAADAKKFVTSAKFVEATFEYWCRQTAKRYPDTLE
jgi:L-fuculose-phosphate aldolase